MPVGSQSDISIHGMSTQMFRSIFVRAQVIYVHIQINVVKMKIWGNLPSMQTSAQQCPQQAESRVHRQPESGIIHLHHNHNLPGLEHRCSCESWYDFPRMVGFSLVDKIWFHFHLFVCVFAVPSLFVGFCLSNMQMCLETFAIVFVVVRLFVLLSGQIYRCIIFYLDNTNGGPETWLNLSEMHHTLHPDHLFCKDNIFFFFIFNYSNYSSSSPTSSMPSQWLGLVNLSSFSGPQALAPDPQLMMFRMMIPDDNQSWSLKHGLGLWLQFH